MNNVNDEVAKFDREFKDWWNAKGEFRALHEIHDLRLYYIILQINKYITDTKLTSQDIKILDYGCGGGLISSNLAKKGYDITGVDLNQTIIEQNNSNFESENLKFMCCDVQYLLSHGYRYNIILCLEVLEHIEEVQDFIFNIVSLLSKKGIIIFSTINRNIKSFIHAIVLAEYILKWVAKGTHQYNKFLKPSEIHNILRKSNIVIKELKGFTFSLEHKKWILTRNVDVNYFLVATSI